MIWLAIFLIPLATLIWIMLAPTEGTDDEHGQVW